MSIDPTLIGSIASALGAVGFAKYISYECDVYARRKQGAPTEKPPHQPSGFEREPLRGWSPPPSPPPPRLPSGFERRPLEGSVVGKLPDDLLPPAPPPAEQDAASPSDLQALADSAREFKNWFLEHMDVTGDKSMRIPLAELRDSYESFCYAGGYVKIPVLAFNDIVKTIARQCGCSYDERTEHVLGARKS